MSNLKISNPSGAYIYQRGSLAVPRDERSGLWTRQGGNYYAGCPSCGAINRFGNSVGTYFEFDHRNLYACLDSCIICRACDSHFFIALDGHKQKLDPVRQKLLRTFRRICGEHLRYGTLPGSLKGDWVGCFTIAVKSHWAGSLYRRYGMYYVTTSRTETTKGSLTFSTLEAAVEKLSKQVRKHLRKG